MMKKELKLEELELVNGGDEIKFADDNPAVGPGNVSSSDIQHGLMRLSIALARWWLTRD